MKTIIALVEISNPSSRDVIDAENEIKRISRFRLILQRLSI